MKLLILFLIMLPLSVFSQNNNAYVSGGYLGLLYSANVNVEHRLSNAETNNIFHAKATLGKLWAANIFNEESGDDFNSNLNIGLGVVYLFRKDANALELGLGYGLISRSDFSRSVPTGNIGYRHQGDKSIFRVGLGFVEGVYVSYGFRF